MSKSIILSKNNILKHYVIKFGHFIKIWTVY